MVCSCPLAGVPEGVCPPDGVPLIELQPRAGAAADDDEFARAEQRARHGVLRADDAQGVHRRPLRHDRQRRGAGGRDVGRREGGRRLRQQTDAAWPSRQGTTIADRTMSDVDGFAFSTSSGFAVGRLQLRDPLVRVGQVLALLKFLDELL